MQLQEPYQPRPIRFLELWQTAGWTLKLYGIAYSRPLPRPELLAAAKEVAATQLAKLQTQEHYHLGFMGVHDGRGANFVFVDYWADENELHHHVYISPAEHPARFEYATPTGLIACVWDLRVICFERQAWLETALANPAGPNLQEYLERRLHEDA